MRIFLLLIISSYCIPVFGQTDHVLNNTLTVAVYHNTKNHIPLGYGETSLSKEGRALKTKLKAAEIGTGFIYRYQNVPYLVTAAHVIDAAKLKDGNIKAIDRDNNKYTMELVGGDTFYDIAILKFKPGIATEHFKGLKFSTARANMRVTALGGSLGNIQGEILKEVVFLNGEKFISKHNRYLKSSTKVTPGYSGGPLCHANDIVGINICRNKKQDATYSLEGQFAEKHLQQIITNNGRIVRAFLGFEWKQSSFKTENVVLSNVIHGSPAAKYENYIGYELTKINGKVVKNIFTALILFERTTPNTPLKITLEKGKNHKTISIIPTILDTKALEKIATHAFRIHSPYTIHYLSKKPSNNRSNIYCVKKEVEYLPFQHLDVVFNLGIGEWAKMYRVTNMKDVGVVIRICSLFGEPISFRTKKQGSDTIPIQPKRFKLYEDDSIKHRVLYF